MQFKSYMKSPFSRLDFSSLIPIIIILSFFVIGFKYIKNLFLNPKEDSKNESIKKAYSNLITESEASTNVVKIQKDQLEKKGLTVQGLHLGIANQLHSLINSAIVDEKKIISIIKGIKSPDTIRLVFVAYGSRQIKSYRNTHFFDADVWKGLFAGDDLFGNLSEHLRIILSDSEQKQISTQLKYMI